MAAIGRLSVGDTLSLAGRPLVFVVLEAPFRREGLWHVLLAPLGAEGRC